MTHYHYASAEAIAPGATPVNPNGIPFDAIYVGGGGNMTIKLEDGQTVAFNGALAGHIYPIRGRWVTSASATNLVALYKGLS